VPSKTTQSDEARPGLRTIVGTVVEHTASRFERLLRPTDMVYSVGDARLIGIGCGGSPATRSR